MALVVFLLTYVFLAGFKLPWIKLDRTGAALVGATAMVGLGIIAPSEVTHAIDLDTIVLLLGMMLLAAYLTRAGFFRATAYYVLRDAARALVRVGDRERRALGVPAERHGVPDADAVGVDAGEER